MSASAPTTSQDATKNRLLMMEKSIAILGGPLTRFTKSHKIPSGGISSNQKYRSRSRRGDHYPYYRKSRSHSPQRFSKSSRHYMVIKQNTSSLLAFQHPQQFFESRTFVSLDIDAMTVLGKASQPADVI